MAEVTELHPETEDDMDDDEPTGQSLDEMTGDDGEEQHMEEVVTGTSGQLGWTVGGKKPTGSKVSIGSAGREVDGQFKKGDVIQVLVTARVDEVSFGDKHDSQGVAIECTRMHKVKPLSVRIVNDMTDDSDDEE